MIVHQQDSINTYALRSLLSIEMLSVLTSIHHLDELGIVFLVPSVLAVGLPLIFIWWFLKKGSNVARWAYSTFAALLILGFGLYDGLWNHTIKVIVFFLRGADRVRMAGLPFPPVGSVFHEVTGVLTFVAALIGAYFTYKFIRTSTFVTRQVGS
jgi:hypothetical protein